LKSLRGAFVWQGGKSLGGLRSWEGFLETPIHKHVRKKSAGGVLIDPLILRKLQQPEVDAADDFFAKVVKGMEIFSGVGSGWEN